MVTPLETVLLATIVAAIMGWTAGTVRSLELIQRQMRIEAFLRGLYSQKARKEKKDQTDALVAQATEFAKRGTVMTDGEILARAREQGLLVKVHE